MVALSFGALSLSSSPQVKNSCPFWAGSSVILSGIIGLTTWKRPMILLVNLFVLLSVVCILLNLAGFILGCQGAQFVSSVPRCDLVDLGEGKICFCCEEFQPAKCTDKENALKLFPVQPCSAVHLLLKKVLFALCALNALTTTVCLVAAALRYLQIFASRRPCIDESQMSAEDVEEHGRIPDPDDFVPPVPPPSYFATFYSCTPRMNRRYHSYVTLGSLWMVGSDVIPLPHIYGARIKGVEVFCPLDPPPPYEAVVSQTDQEQESSFQMPEGPETAGSPAEPVCTQITQASEKPESSPPSEDKIKERPCASPFGGESYPGAQLRSCNADRKEARSRYSDSEERREATGIKMQTPLSDRLQIMAPSQPSTSQAQELSWRRQPGLLHLRSCGDLSTFSLTARPRAERRPQQRAEAERPHSLIGVIRETVL
ncbi:mCG113702 [Mus musculus]|nr:mCG113702 [Mus musculus]